MSHRWRWKRYNEERAERELARLLDLLPAGQYRVAVALLTIGTCPTYKEVAAHLNLSLGTVHTHLGRIRLNHSQLYKALMKERARQLKTRHREAVKRARAHTRRWRQITQYRDSPFDRA